jgi:5-methylcytosine-specific restriction endonuclease McrA
VTTILPRSLGPEELKYPPPNLATIEHAFHRLDPRRKSGKKGRRILACYNCNHKKGAEDLKKFLNIKLSNKRLRRILKDFEINFEL